ncbi:MAG: hypothetical protein QNJ33_14090 [Crocosphaera sp.]|nr:hypothetical protein [Crocosphaera sp.]
MIATMPIGQVCAATQPSETYSEQRRQRLDWLLSNGLPPLPVAPFQDPHRYHKVVKASNTRGAHCPLTQDLQPIPLFTGKNPSFLDADGIPHLINHHIYQSRLPSKKELKRWFKHPDNGIGTLGSDRVKWIDIDSKQFRDQAACDKAFKTLLEQRPELRLTLLEKTQSGGYRIGLKAEADYNCHLFTNFSLSPGGSHVGECLGEGRFTVLSPTIGPTGKPYVNINCPKKLVKIDKIDFIFPTKAKSSQTPLTPKKNVKISTATLPGSIPLEMLGHEDSHRVLNGEDIKNDRSDSLTTAISEWSGWFNWCHSNNIPVSGTVENLAYYAGEKLGIDSDRITRILATIDLEQCHPSAHFRGGDEACWRKVRRLDRRSYDANCPDSIKEAISGNPPNRGNNNGGNGGGGGGHNGDGFLPERNKWNSPVSWNGELGYWNVVRRNKVDAETGEILEEKETVRVFVPKCNFDLEIERELSDGEGGGLVLQVKRSIDHKQRRVIIGSTERLTVKEFNLALTKAYRAGIICNLKTDQLNGLIQTKLIHYHDRGGKVFKLADRIGQQSDGTWVFSDRQMTEKGIATSEAQTRTIYNPNLGYEDHISIPEIVTPNSQALSQLVNAMHRFHGDSQIAPAILTLGWSVACLHFQEIINIEKRFPLLNLFGDPGCGKTIMAENGLSLAGFVQGSGSFCKVTESALYEHLKLSGSLPLLWDDPDKSPWLDTLIQRLYNGKPRMVRGNSQSPHTSLMITSNHVIGDAKPATLSRILPLAIFPSTDGDKNSWDDLVEAQKGASGALPQLIELGYPSEQIRALAKELRPLLPHAHCRVADSIALVLHYATAVCRLAGFDERRIYDYVVGTVCKTANDADSASDSLTDFLDKISALHSQSVVGEWNIRLITTRSGFEGLAVNMSSVWAKVDGTYKVPYSRKVIESQIAQAGGVLKSAQKFYRSEDEVKSYRRSLINGHNEGDDYVPPKPPEETTRKCVLIPLRLVKDFISSWRDDDSPPDGGGGNRPHPDPISPTGGDSVTTSDDGSVASYPPVDGNLSEKGNFENDDCTMVSDDDSTSSYLFKQDTKNLEEENEQGVQILTDDNGGENSTEKNATSSKQVTTTETDGCNLDIMQETEVDPKSLPSEPKSENEVIGILDWQEVLSSIDSEMTRLGWDIERGQRHLIETYGVRSRLKLSDRQLLEFLGYLKSQPTFKVGQTVLFQGLRVVIERFVNDIIAVVRAWENPSSKSFEAAIAHLSPVMG